jgi:hypothetical protein
MGELDRLDEQLFAERLDFEGARAARGLPVEPPTVRLAGSEPGGAEPRTAGPYRRDLDAETRDLRIVIAWAGLLLVVLIGFGAALWWS